MMLKQISRKLVVVFCAIMLLLEGMGPHIPVRAAVERYVDLGDVDCSFRVRKSFGLVAENVKDVKISQEGDTCLFVSQKKGEYRYIDFSTKLKTKKNEIYYKSNLVARNIKKLFPVGRRDLFMLDSKGYLRFSGYDMYYPILRYKKQKTPLFEVLALKKVGKCWSDKCMFAYIKNNKLNICRESNEKSVKEQYFAGKGRNIKKVVAGLDDFQDNNKKYYNLFVLMKNGDVYGVGSNKYHLISDSDEKYYSEPTKINVSGVQDISACDRGVAVLKKNGSLWMWGERRTGKQYKTKKYSAKPYKIANKVDEFSLSTSDYEDDTCFVLFLKKGTAYGWGANRLYELTSANKQKWYQKPVKLKSGIKHVYSSEHMSLLLDQKGNLYWSGFWEDYGEDFSWAEKRITGKK